MSSIDDSFVLKCLCGCPIFFDDICAIYPATLREIAQVGYNNFTFYLSLVLMKRPVDVGGEAQNIIDALTDFEYLLLMANSDAQMNQKMKEAFRFFIHDNVTFSINPPQIIVGNASDKYILNEENYYEFQKYIRKIFFVNQSEQEIEIEKNDNPFVAAMKRKMLANREKVAKAKAKKATDDNDMQFSDLVASMSIAQCDLNISNIWDISYYAFNDQLKRLGWRDRFNINNRAALAGAKVDKKDLQHWMRSINSKSK